MSTIDALYDDLQDKLKQRPDSTILQSTLDYLSQARVGLTSVNLHTFLEQLRSYLDKLEEEGLWEWTPEKERLLQDLVYELAKIPPSQEPVRPHTPSVSSEASSSHENDTSISSGPIVARKGISGRIIAFVGPGGHEEALWGVVQGPPGLSPP